nr:MAG TPA: hypothetical protein [Caudoviricetes sp.]
MKRIENWDSIVESTSFKRLTPNGYICKILKVEDHPEKEYLKIYFDIFKGDDKGYFKKQYDGDTRKEKKWSNAGTFIRSYKDSAASMFKGFTNAVEKSNKGYKWDFDEKTLVNKIVGLIIADEQYQNQKGQVRVRNYVAAVRSVETIEKGEYEIPALKELTTTKTTTSTPANDPLPDFGDVFNTTPTDTPTPDESENPWDDSDENPFNL